jgi:lipopolysaccharide biosynthesis glycosyltransferase
VKVSNINITRYFKLFLHLFFKDYELSIYIDASYIINGDLNELLLKALNPSFDLYFIQHPFRKKVFQEFKAILKYKKENRKIINLVRKRYIKENFPDNLGLTENNIII